MDRSNVCREGRLANDKLPGSLTPVYIEDDIWATGTTVEVIESFPTETVKGRKRNVIYLAFKYQDPDLIAEDLSNTEASMDNNERGSAL